MLSSSAKFGYRSASTWWSGFISDGVGSSSKISRTTGGWSGSELAASLFSAAPPQPVSAPSAIAASAAVAARAAVARRDSRRFMNAMLTRPSAFAQHFAGVLRAAAGDELLDHQSLMVGEHHIACRHKSLLPRVDWHIMPIGARPSRDGGPTGRCGGLVQRLV